MNTRPLEKKQDEKQILRKENKKLWREIALKQTSFLAFTFMLYYNHMR